MVELGTKRIVVKSTRRLAEILSNATAVDVYPDSSACHALELQKS
jgi:hypothetical protein